MNRKSILAPVILLALAGASARAQSELGSPKVEATFSASYRQAVEAAFPGYEDAALRKRRGDLAWKYRAGRDALQVRKLDQLEKVMSLPHAAVPPGETHVATPEREYGVIPAEGRVLLLQDPGTPAQ